MTISYNYDIITAETWVTVIRKGGYESLIAALVEARAYCKEHGLTQADVNVYSHDYINNYVELVYVEYHDKGKILLGDLDFTEMNVIVYYKGQIVDSPCFTTWCEAKRFLESIPETYSSITGKNLISVEMYARDKHTYTRGPLMETACF